MTEDGRLINVVGSPAPDAEAPTTNPRVGARAALAAGLEGAGVEGAAPRVRDVDGVSLATDFAGLSSAELTLFGEGDDLSLAWTVFADAGSEAFYYLVVDAGTGEVLRRINLVQDANNANVFDYFPGAPSGGALRTVDLSPWLTNPNATDDMFGPNAVAWGDFNDDDQYQDNGPANCFENICPSNAAPPFQYQYGYPNIQFNGGNCPAIGCGWNFNFAAPDPNSWFFTTMDRTGAQAFYFVNNLHDFLRDDPQIAFTSASGNFEGNDPVVTQVVDGANGAGGLPNPSDHANNANMLTLPEGTPPRMQMYLFGSVPPLPNVRAVSGADDAAVVYHEYVHGLSGRLVVDAQGANGLAPENQPGALGEAWSDWYAMDYLVAKGFQPDTGAPGEVVLSVFESLTPTDFRRNPLDCPVGGTCPGTPSAGAGGFTFGDYGRILGGPEVHADGEIWAETLWDLRTAVGSDTAQGLITGGLRLTPPAPTFLQARDAILQQAQATGGATLFQQVFEVFAARGMGANAFTAGPADNAPIEDFSVPAPPPPPAPPSCRGNQADIAGTVLSERIKGTNASEVISGGDGSDRITGGGGRDLICGGGGADKINGGGGNDIIIGGGGKDLCKGGKGRDRGSGCERGSQ